MTGRHHDPGRAHSRRRAPTLRHRRNRPARPLPRSSCGVRPAAAGTASERSEGSVAAPARPTSSPPASPRRQTPDPGPTAGHPAGRRPPTHHPPPAPPPKPPRTGHPHRPEHRHPPARYHHPGRPADPEQRHRPARRRLLRGLLDRRAPPPSRLGPIRGQPPGRVRRTRLRSPRPSRQRCGRGSRDRPRRTRPTTRPWPSSRPLASYWPVSSASIAGRRIGQ